MAEDKKSGVPIDGPLPEEQTLEPPALEVPEAPPAPEQTEQAVIPGMEGPRPRRTR